MTDSAEAVPVTEADLAARNPKLPPDITSISDRELAGLYWAGHPDDDDYIVNRTIKAEIDRRGMDPARYNSYLWLILLLVGGVIVIVVGAIFVLPKIDQMKDWMLDHTLGWAARKVMASRPLQLTLGVALVVVYGAMLVRQSLKKKQGGDVRSVAD